MLLKQDQASVRTPEDVLRRINVAELKEALEMIEKIRKEMIIDTQLSISSRNPVENRAITQAVNQKVTKVAGKGLSTNDFTNKYKSKLDTVITDLTNYAVSGLTIVNISCTTKDNRVCIDFTGSIDLLANTLTTIFSLPQNIIPNVEKNFYVTASGKFGYGVIDVYGNLQIEFSENISNKTIRFSAVYDLEEVEE